MNFLTFDVAEWFQLPENPTKEDAWLTYEPRLEANAERILRILDEMNAKATFFVTDWVARHHPETVRMIARKYEVGLFIERRQTVEKEDVMSLKNKIKSLVERLEDIGGRKIRYARTTEFAKSGCDAEIVKVLNECGIGAVNDVICRNFRLIPYFLLKRKIKNSDNVLLDIALRDFDVSQPMLRELRMSCKIKYYIGLQEAERKLRKLLKDFRFEDDLGCIFR